MAKILNRLFLTNSWTIGWRKLESKFEELPKDSNTKIKFTLLSAGERYYYADSFVFEQNDEAYLFCEIMDRYRKVGTIGVSKFKGKNFGRFKEIIREPFHMSYPNVFLYKNQIYMIPESSEINEVRLYKAEKFPYDWKYEKTILSGKPYVDSSVIVKEDEILLYTYYIDQNNNGIREKHIITENFNNIIKDSAEKLVQERPAGNPIVVDGKIYSPLQDCGEYYGKGIIWGILENGEEIPDGMLTPKTYQIRINPNNVTGTHTINRSEHFEVMDIRLKKYCLTKYWIKIYRKCKRLFK